MSGEELQRRDELGLSLTSPAVSQRCQLFKSVTPDKISHKRFIYDSLRQRVPYTVRLKHHVCQKWNRMFHPAEALLEEDVFKVLPKHFTAVYYTTLSIDRGVMLMWRIEPVTCVYLILTHM